MNGRSAAYRERDNTTSNSRPSQRRSRAPRRMPYGRARVAGKASPTRRAVHEPGTNRWARGIPALAAQRQLLTCALSASASRSTRWISRRRPPGAAGQVGAIAARNQIRSGRAAVVSPASASAITRFSMLLITLWLRPAPIEIRSCSGPGFQCSSRQASCDACPQMAARQACERLRPLVPLPDAEIADAAHRRRAATSKNPSLLIHFAVVPA